METSSAACKWQVATWLVLLCAALYIKSFFYMFAIIFKQLACIYLNAWASMAMQLLDQSYEIRRVDKQDLYPSVCSWENV